MEHPYKEFEGLVIWQAIEKAVSELEQNNDLVISTAKEYVVGYLCKSIVEGYSVDTDLS